MVDIKPVKVVILNPEIKDRERLICPVYDTIDSAQYRKYSSRPDNVINYITRDKDNMTPARFVNYALGKVKEAFDKGILVEHPSESFYIYGIRYKLTDDIAVQIPEKERRDNYFIFGLVCLVKIEEMGKDNIMGHEKVFKSTVDERYELMSRGSISFSPIVAEYSMPGHDINNIFQEYLGFKRPNIVLNKKPLIDVEFNGTRHLLWSVDDKDIIKNVQGLIKDKKLLILDGHHRYTATNLLRERDGKEYGLMMLVEGGDRALVLLPWHRCFKNLDVGELWTRIKRDFRVTAYSSSQREDFLIALRDGKGSSKIRFGIYDRSGYSILELAGDIADEFENKMQESIGLDLLYLHNKLLDGLYSGVYEDALFTPLPHVAIERVDQKSFDVGFIIEPLQISEVERKAHEERKNFPQKSTYFLPKVIEGIVMRKIE